MPEEFLDFLNHFHETVHFGFRVVKVKACPRRSGQPEFAHERLVAVMAAAQRNAFLVGERHHIVRMRSGKSERHHAAAMMGGSEHADAWDLRLEPRIGERGQLLVVARDFLSSQALQWCSRRGEAI